MKTFHVHVAWEWCVPQYHLPFPRKYPKARVMEMKESDPHRYFPEDVRSGFGHALKQWCSDLDPLEQLAYLDNLPERQLERELRNVTWVRPSCYSAACVLIVELQFAVSDTDLGG